MPPLAGIDKLRADYDAVDKEIDTVMAVSVTENRSVNAEEITKIKELDTRAVAIKEAIAVAERREDRQTERDKPPESRGVRSAPPGPAPAPAVHTEKRQYSILRAIRIEAGLEDRGGVEWECHQEMERRAKASNRVVHGILMPVGSDAETRQMMGRPAMERRDVTTTTVASTIYLRPEGFIDLLRANTVLQQLGATFLTGLKGIFAMTRQNSTNTFQWVAEGNSATPTNFGFDRVPFSPKFAVASQILTREALMQTSIDLDKQTEDDFAKIHALGVDAAVINGPGGAAPLGLLNNPAVPVYTVKADTGNGGVFTYADAVNMESTVAQANALRGKMAFLTNPRMRGSLKQQMVGTGGYPTFVFGKGTTAEVGEINGYDAYVSTLVPANLSKGSAVNTLSAIIYAMWADVIVAQYDTGGLDMVVDPYTLKRSGSVEMTTYLALDTNIRHPESVLACTDALP